MSDFNFVIQTDDTSALELKLGQVLQTASTAAAASAADAKASETAAANSATNAAASATGAANSASASAASAEGAGDSAATAYDSATSAAASASSAGTSASNAAASEGNAATSAENAAVSATNSANSAAAAADSASDAAATLASALTKAANLSDVENASAARANIGLGDVDNTADADKPISTLQQGALDEKAAKGENGDITSLTGLTTPLSIAQGGTGANSANAAADALGAYRKGTILGGVGQTDGVPIGAIIERGKNANGEYVRFADGTQICFGVFASTVPVAPGGYVAPAPTLPVVFVGTPAIQTEILFFAGGAAAGVVLFSIRQGYLSSASANFGVYINSGRSSASDVPSLTLGSVTAQSYWGTFMAIGRWF